MSNKPFPTAIFTALTKRDSYAHHQALNPPLDVPQKHAPHFDLQPAHPQDPLSATNAKALKYHTRLAPINAHFPPQNQFVAPLTGAEKAAADTDDVDALLHADLALPQPHGPSSNTVTAELLELKTRMTAMNAQVPLEQQFLAPPTGAKHAAAFGDDVDAFLHAEVRELSFLFQSGFNMNIS
jgi:hypothetical protein